VNSKNTWVWFLMAATLFATIWFLDHHFQATVPMASEGWPDFELAPASNVQVIPAGALEISADRTNNNWFLTRPFAYPAQSAAVQALLDALTKLTPAVRISSDELRQQPTADKDYGFDIPPVSLVIKTPYKDWQLKIGRRTAPGNQVYLRVVGVDGAFVTDAAWLKLLPAQAKDWRDTSLVGTEAQFDTIVLTNGAKVIELRQDPTNGLWRMTRPLQARADSSRINLALEQLRAARVEDFVTDDPQTDLSAYGLQPASLDLWLGHGGSLTDGLHLGETPTNNPALVYAKREGWNGVVTTQKEPLAPWRGTVVDFRDTHLVNLTAPVNQIDVLGMEAEGRFSLQRQGTNWQVAGETFPVDAQNVQDFIKLLGSLTTTEFVSDVATAPDLQVYGLTKPGLQITLRTAAGDTNPVLVQLSFSTPQTNGVFVRRSDEEFIYRLDPSDLNRIPPYAWQYRDRQIWNFDEKDITQIILHQNGQTRQMLHQGKDQWVLAPGSPGEIYGPTIEETAHQLGTLAAIGWVGRKVPNPEVFGVTATSLQIETDLKDGRKFTLDYGRPIYGQPVAMVTLAGERWALVVPEILNQLVMSYLTVPANTP